MTRRTGVLPALALSVAVLGALFTYKWSAAYRAVAKVSKAGVYTPAPEWISTAGLSFPAEAAARTANYLAAVWPALVFGVLIAGLVRAFISPAALVRLLGVGAARRQIRGGLAAMPLMLCSCCISPIFSSVRAGGAGLAPALAVMLGSPSLNLAALSLTFLLFPPGIAAARLGLAAFAVFLLPLAVERWAGETSAPVPPPEPSVGPPPRGPAVLAAWLRASASIAWRTVPLIVLGVFASSLLAGWVAQPAAHGATAGLSVAAIALCATLLAFPTFWEIPFALMLAGSGFPQGAVAAVLFAGPAINLPSLFTLAKASSKRVAVLVFLGVWSAATFAGLALNL